MIDLTDTNSEDVAYLTDFRSVLDSLSGHGKQNLRRKLYIILEHRRVVLQWIPAHCGIKGNEHADRLTKAPNDTAYKWWSCHSGLKLLCKLCRTFPPPAMGTRFTVFGNAGHADPLDGWRCCSQRRLMSRPIPVRQL